MLARSPAPPPATFRLISHFGTANPGALELSMIWEEKTAYLLAIGPDHGKQGRRASRRRQRGGGVRRWGCRRSGGVAGGRRCWRSGGWVARGCRGDLRVHRHGARELGAEVRRDDLDVQAGHRGLEHLPATEIDCHVRDVIA